MANGSVVRACRVREMATLRGNVGVRRQDRRYWFSGSTPMSDVKARFATMLIAATVAACAVALPVAAQEPSVVGLWQKLDEEGKPVGWFLFVEHNGTYEGAIAKLF